jgi:two-component system sensor histidine kinase LytS
MVVYHCHLQLSIRFCSFGILATTSKIRRYNEAALLHKHSWIPHTALWVGIVAAILVFREYPEHFTGPEAVCFVIQLIILMALPGYLSNYVLLPIVRNKPLPVIIVSYALFVALMIFVTPYVLNAVGVLFRSAFGTWQSVDWTRERIGFSIFGVTLTAIFLKFGWDQLLASAAQKEAELRHLRQQLNPHFLFNTLNNLYGLAVAKSDRLPGLMLKLGQLLRYSITEADAPTVPLTTELQHISDYIELQRIRLDEQVEVRFEIAGERGDLQIAPLILMVFIENAFKHHDERDDGNFIVIDIRVDNRTLYLQVRNSFDPTTLRADNVKAIGIGNARRQLKLLYPGKHILTSRAEGAQYITQLEMQL